MEEYLGPLIEDRDLGLASGRLAGFARSERFLTDHFSLHAGAATRLPPAGRPGFVVHGGGTVMLGTGGDRFRGTEAFFDYGTRLEMSGDALRMAVGLRGWLNATAEDAGFDERTVHQIELIAGDRRGRIRPSALLRLPLHGDPARPMHAVLGIAVEIVGG